MATVNQNTPAKGPTDGCFAATPCPWGQLCRLQFSAPSPVPCFGLPADQLAPCAGRRQTKCLSLRVTLRRFFSLPQKGSRNKNTRLRRSAGGGRSGETTFRPSGFSRATAAGCADKRLRPGPLWQNERKRRYKPQGSSQPPADLTLTDLTLSQGKRRKAKAVTYLPREGVMR